MTGEVADLVDIRPPLQRHEQFPHCGPMVWAMFGLLDLHYLECAADVPAEGHQHPWHCNLRAPCVREAWGVADDEATSEVRLDNVHEPFPVFFYCRE
jgi:hypothetical protein